MGRELRHHPYDKRARMRDIKKHPEVLAERLIDVHTV
jgi:hypothetical protein